MTREVEPPQHASTAAGEVLGRRNVPSARRAAARGLDNRLIAEGWKLMNEACEDRSRRTGSMMFLCVWLRDVPHSLKNLHEGRFLCEPSISSCDIPRVYTEGSTFTGRTRSRTEMPVPRQTLTILGLGSLLSERSARVTFPELTGWRRTRSRISARLCSHTFNIYAKRHADAVTLRWLPWVLTRWCFLRRHCIRRARRWHWDGSLSRA